MQLPARPCAVIAAGILAALTLTSCALFGIPSQHVFPDDFEQAVIDTLDADPLVQQHDAAIDYWEHPENIDAPRASVTLSERVDANTLADLLVRLTDLAVDHGQTLPPLDLSAPASNGAAHHLTLSGNLAPDDLRDVAAMALGTPFRSVSIWADRATPYVTVRAWASSPDEAQGLHSEELPSYVREHMSWSTVTVDALTTVPELRGDAGLPHPSAFDIAEAFEGADLDAPSEAERFEATVTTRHAGSSATVQVDVTMHDEHVRAAEADDRPRVAEERGYLAFCESLRALVEENAADVDARTSCNVHGELLEVS